MNKKKIIVFLLLVISLVLTGCGGDSTPKRLWNNYIKAMNSKKLENVAEFYYPKGTPGYENFINTRDPEEYFNFDKLKTLSFTPVVDNEKYYSAEIVLDVDNGSYENVFMVYFYRNPGEPWKFISEVQPNAYDFSELGNKPNNEYYNNIVKKDDKYYYKYVYATKPGEVGPNDYVKLVYPIRKERVIELPDTIEGVPVTEIGDFAFFDFFRIFTVTFPNSKLEYIKLPSSLKVINNYAFYQAKRLKEIELPSTVTTVGEYAFASSGLQKLIINVNDQAAYDALEAKTGSDKLTIIADKEVYMGDNVVLRTLGYQNTQIEWSTNNPEIATITVTSGTARLQMNKAGTVEVTAKLITDNPNDNYAAKATITIKEQSEKMIKSTTPPNPFSNFTFNIRRVFYTTEEFSATMSLTPIWSTSDPNIAVVDNGKIKFVGAGTVTITASPQANPTVSTSATVIVRDISEKTVKSTFTYDNFTFTGARDMFTGDIVKVTAPGFQEGQIEWSVDNESVATIGRYNGVITAVGAGNVTIRGVRVDNPSIESIVTIRVSNPVKGPTFLVNSLDRLYNLKVLVINAINPNSVEFQGTVKFPADLKIYVPAQNIESYKKKFASHANNIYPIEEYYNANQ